MQDDKKGASSFGQIAESAKRQLVHDLLAWQERWHARLERIAFLVDGQQHHLPSGNKLFLYDNDADTHFNYTRWKGASDD